jgi:hypothetical protein
MNPRPKPVLPFVVLEGKRGCLKLGDATVGGVGKISDSTVAGEKVRVSIVIARCSSLAFSAAISAALLSRLARRLERWLEAPNKGSPDIISDVWKGSGIIIPAAKR